MTHAFLLAAFALAAFLYASVGHGGASAYLAILILAGWSKPEIASTVLVMNLFVSSIALHRFRRAGHLDVPLLGAFLLFSVPAAYLGGATKVSSSFFGTILGLALALAAVRLVLPDPRPRAAERPSGRRLWLAAAPLGVGLGLLSGLTGVGGGIYLSPLLILLGWKDAKGTAGVSAGFIFANSAAGLAGRFGRGEVVDRALLPFLAAAIVSGFFGARWGADHAPPLLLRRLLGAVLAIAAAKLLVA